MAISAVKKRYTLKIAELLAVPINVIEINIINPPIPLERTPANPNIDKENFYEYLVLFLNGKSK
ncbi:MAG: hypothetical protein ACE5R6_14935 [Candidatus Heimdallarchaeota archaeon]